MVLSVIALAVILVTIMLSFSREIAIGPLYLLVPVVTFVAGSYWYLRRSSRPMVPAKPPSRATIIAKSTLVGATVMILSVICYLIWIWLRTRRDGIVFVSFDIVSLLNWPVLVGVFLVGFILEYRLASRRRFRLTGGMAQ